MSSIEEKIIALVKENPEAFYNVKGTAKKLG